MRQPAERSSVQIFDVASDPQFYFAFSQTVPRPRRADELTLSQTVLAGGVAGCVAKTVTAPLERMKLEAQTSSAAFDAVAEARQIVRSEGVLGLFRGNLLNCLRTFPAGAVSCTAFVTLLNAGPEKSEAWRVWSCCFATAAASAVTYPLDSLRTRWTVAGGIAGSPESVRGLVLAIHRADGLRSLFRGIGPSLYSVIPWVAVQQYTLDFFRFAAMKDRGYTGYEPSLLIAVGAVSGLVAQTVVHPLEVLRRRMQLGRSGDVVTTEASVVPNRTWDAFKHVVKNEGVAALYSGITAHWLKCVPNAAVGYLVCLSLCDYFKRHNQDNAIRHSKIAQERTLAKLTTTNDDDATLTPRNKGKQQPQQHSPQDAKNLQGSSLSGNGLCF